MQQNFETLYGEEVDQSSHGHTVRMTPPSRKGYLYQMLCMIGWSSLPFLPTLSQPTLILAGDKDNIVPVANAKILNKFIRNARLHVVEGGGHLFIVSRADDVLPMIQDFLDGDDEGASEAA